MHSKLGFVRTSGFTQRHRLYPRIPLRSRTVRGLEQLERRGYPTMRGPYGCHDIRFEQEGWWVGKVKLGHRLEDCAGRKVLSEYTAVLRAE